MAYVYIFLVTLFAFLIAAAWIKFEDDKEQGVRRSQDNQEERDT